MSRITAWVGRGFTRLVDFSRSSFVASGVGGQRDADSAFVRTVYAEHGDAMVAVPAEDEFFRTLQSWQVAEALRTLRPAHRAVLVETYYRGQSVSETAEVLGIPADTVKSCCYYALQALRLALQEQAEEP